MPTTTLVLEDTVEVKLPGFGPPIDMELSVTVAYEPELRATRDVPPEPAEVDMLSIKLEGSAPADETVWQEYLEDAALSAFEDNRVAAHQARIESQVDRAREDR